MAWGALIGICGADGESVIIDMARVVVMQVAGVEVVHMTGVLHRGMAAAGAVLMGMGLRVLGMGGTAGGNQREGDQEREEFFHLDYCG